MWLLFTRVDSKSKFGANEVIIIQRHEFDLPFEIQAVSWWEDKDRSCRFTFKDAQVSLYSLESCGIKNGEGSKPKPKRIAFYSHGGDALALNRVCIDLEIESSAENMTKYQHGMRSGYWFTYYLAQDILDYVLSIIRERTGQWWINRLFYVQKGARICDTVQLKQVGLSNNWETPDYIPGGFSFEATPGLFAANVQILGDRIWQSIHKDLISNREVDLVRQLKEDVKLFVVSRAFNVALFTLAQAIEFGTKRRMEELAQMNGNNLKKLLPKKHSSFCNMYLRYVPQQLGLRHLPPNTFNNLERLFRIRNKIAHEGKAYFTEPAGWSHPTGTHDIPVNLRVDVDEYIAMSIISSADIFLWNLLNGNWL